METKINVRKWSGLVGFIGCATAAIMEAHYIHSSRPPYHYNGIFGYLTAAIWAWAYFDLATKKENDGRPTISKR